MENGEEKNGVEVNREKQNRVNEYEHKKRGQKSLNASVQEDTNNECRTVKFIDSILSA